MPSYMITLRDANDEAKVAPPRYLVLDDNGAPQAIEGEAAWRDAILASFPKNKLGQASGDLLFFVHGFNVGFDHARNEHMANKAALIRNGWTGLLVSFDWPSYGEVLQYYGDRSNARLSANSLVDTALALFVATLAPDCDIRVSVMAHSMGALVVRLALTWAHQDPKTNSKAWNLSQVVLVAGDVAEGSLSATQDGGKWLDRYSGRTTSYANKFDSVLKISDVKNGDPTPRAGRVGLPDDAPASFCDVDTSAFYASLGLSLSDQFNPATPHTYYFGQDAFWQDVVLTLYGGIDRKAIPTRSIDPAAAVANRFLLQTKVMGAAPYALAVANAKAGAVG